MGKTNKKNDGLNVKYDENNKRIRSKTTEIPQKRTSTSSISSQNKELIEDLIDQRDDIDILPLDESTVIATNYSNISDTAKSFRRKSSKKNKKKKKKLPMSSPKLVNSLSSNSIRSRLNRSNSASSSKHKASNSQSSIRINIIDDDIEDERVTKNKKKSKEKNDNKKKRDSKKLKGIKYNKRDS